MLSGFDLILNRTEFRLVSQQLENKSHYASLIKKWKPNSLYACISIIIHVFYLKLNLKKFRETFNRLPRSVKKFLDTNSFIILKYLKG